jgi:hypothetical protein
MKEILDIYMKPLRVEINQIGNRGFRCTIKTAWKPDYEWLESLHKKYPSIWIKNEWISEDGKAGVWIGCKTDIKSMEWDDLSIDDEYYHFNLV